MTESGFPFKVGVVGCGTISPRYFEHLASYDDIDVIACADLDPDQAESAAERFGVLKACSVDELLADPEVDLVLNLTVPQAHAEVSLAAIHAGKHIYSEKPLAVERAEGAAIVRAAAERGVLAGCAPDTFLGAGIQTSRKLLDEGNIGTPIGAAASFTSPGHEHWHPNPGFYYLRGGGPVFDMGPYYLTALVVLLGPITRVCSSAMMPRDVRVSDAHPGVKFPVGVPTHVTGSLDFAAGATASITMSFDVWASEAPKIEIFGTRGTMSVPDPNTFGGMVRVKPSHGEWTEKPPQFREGGRGIGVAEMVSAIRSGRSSRIDAVLANHVLDAMHALHESSDEGRHIDLRSTCARPDPMPASGVM